MAFVLLVLLVFQEAPWVGCEEGSWREKRSSWPSMVLKGRSRRTQTRQTQRAGRRRPGGQGGSQASTGRRGHSEMARRRVLP